MLSRVSIISSNNANIIQVLRGVGTEHVRCSKGRERWWVRGWYSLALRAPSWETGGGTGPSFPQERHTSQAGAKNLLVHDECQMMQKANGLNVSGS